MIFLPIAKLAQIVFPEIEVPSHVLNFYDTPDSFNLATYLDVFYRDFGLAGVVICPWFFGVLSAYVYYVYRVNKRSFWAIFAMSIIVLWTIASPFTAGFIKPSFWFQVFFGYIVYLFIRIKKPTSYN